jgi:hypothetical protein
MTTTTSCHPNHGHLLNSLMHLVAGKENRELLRVMQHDLHHRHRLPLKGPMMTTTLCHPNHGRLLTALQCIHLLHSMKFGMSPLFVFSCLFSWPPAELPSLHPFSRMKAKARASSTHATRPPPPPPPPSATEDDDDFTPIPTPTRFDWFKPVPPLPRRFPPPVQYLPFDVQRRLRHPDWPPS